MPKLEDVLKKHGYTDSDLANMSTMLSDQRFRSSMESSLDEFAEDARKARDAEWETLKSTQWESTLAAREREAVEARTEAARLREQIAIARDYGYLDSDEAKAKVESSKRDQEQREQQQRGGGFDPSDKKFLEFANTFSQREGDSIATHAYLQEEYRNVMGGSINEYVGTDGSRGMIALRRESQSARLPIDQYVEKKFDWAGKRADAQRKATEAHDAEIARQAVEKYQMEHPAAAGNPNPMLYGSSLSNAPFIPKVAEGGKQPWERGTAQERRSQRIENATKTEIKSKFAVQ